MDKIKKSLVNFLIDTLSLTYGADLSFLKKYHFYIRSKGKVYISSIDISQTNLKRINSVGLYFGTFHDDERFRLSIEGSMLVSPTKNFITINSNSLKSYLSGENLFEKEAKKNNSEEKASFYIVRHNNTSIGCVSLKDGYYLNYVSKGRKLDFNKVF